MPLIHAPSISRALYRVFVAPTLTTSLRPQPAILAHSLVLPQITIRTKAYKKPAVRHALSDHFVYDSAIKSPHINYVDDDGVFHGDVTRASVFFNRVTHHLLQVTSGKVDEYGNVDPQNLPTCKLISKMDLRVMLQKKLDLQRRQEKGQGSGPGGKNLELNWAIAGGDLKHRLEKMKEFLKEGRKVEILFGIKKRGRVATKDECDDLIRKVREAVEECKGASQSKAPEGVVGGVMTMFFKGREIEGKDSMTKKEARKGWREAEQEREKEKEKEKEAVEAGI